MITVSGTGRYVVCATHTVGNRAIFKMFVVHCLCQGFTFLRIPRSYYGILTQKDLLEGETPVSAELARSVMEGCEAQGLVTMDGAVDWRNDR